MYCGKTISSSPKKIIGELYITENAEYYIEYYQNNHVVREEIFPLSVQHIDKKEHNFDN